MRLIVAMNLEQESRFPIDHQYALAGAIYRLLRCADVDCAARIRGAEEPRENDKPPMPFCFSGLRCAKRRVDHEELWLGPGRVVWRIGAPDEPLLRAIEAGLLEDGSIRVGAGELAIDGIRFAPTPDFAEGEGQFVCLSPIVATVCGIGPEGAGTRFLRPTDGAAFSEAARANALSKFEALYGRAPKEPESRLVLRFDAGYLARNPRGGTKRVTINGNDVVGAMAPFTALGSPALLQLIYNSGAGEMNGAGFGMIEVSNRRAARAGSRVVHGRRTEPELTGAAQLSGASSVCAVTRRGRRSSTGRMRA
jgi:CRISPR-associated endoribonuclease Cas6